LEQHRVSVVRTMMIAMQTGGVDIGWVREQLTDLDRHGVHFLTVCVAGV